MHQIPSRPGATPTPLQHLAPAPTRPNRYYTFDAAISIHKARNLPSPPALAGGPLVAIRWGAPAPPRRLMSTAASSTVGCLSGAAAQRRSQRAASTTESSPLGDAPRARTRTPRMACMLPCGAQRPQGMATRATLAGRTRPFPLPRRVLSYARVGSSSASITARGRSARRRSAHASSR